MEKMKYITVLNVFAKLIFVVLIFVYVRTEQDYALAALFYSLGFVLAGLASMFVVYRFFKIRFSLPSFGAIVKELKDGYDVFITQLAPSLYTVSNVFILGLLTNNTIVGYYSAGEKLIKAVQSMFNPVSQTIFPHISALAKDSRENALRFVRKAAILSGIFTCGASILLFIFAPQIVAIVFGEKFIPTITVIRILAFLPFVSSMGNIFGTQIMINFGMARIFARIVFYVGLLNIVLALILIPRFLYDGMAAAVMTTESLITIALFILLETNRLSPRKKWLKGVLSK
jgi:PST family polysaccharide transporter